MEKLSRVLQIASYSETRSDDTKADVIVWRRFGWDDVFFALLRKTLWMRNESADQIAIMYFG